MAKLRLVGLTKQRKQILDALQRSGLVEIISSSNTSTLFNSVRTVDERAQFERVIKAAEDALLVLDKVAPGSIEKKGMFEGRKIATQKELDDFYSKSNAIYKKALSVLAADAKLSELDGSLAKLELKLKALSPWKTLSVPLSFTGTENTRAFIGSFEAAKDLSGLDAVKAHINSAVKSLSFEVELISVSKEQLCVVIVTLRESAKRFEQALAEIGFTKPSVESSLIPIDEIRSIEAQANDIRAEKARLYESLKASALDRQNFSFLSDHCRMRLAKYEALTNVSQGEYSFIIEGWIEADKSQGLVKKLEQKFTCAIELIEPEETDDVPIKLRNNMFAGAIESVLTGFGLPQRGEIDPLNVMAIFYYALFGLMFSDAGYGIILTLGCLYILKRFKTMEDGTRKAMRMFMGCGIATTVWGFIFGSFFGNVVASASRIFGAGSIALRPLWYDPVADPMRLLMFSFVIGILHLSTAYLMKALSYVRAGKANEILFDIIFPVFTFYALLVMLMGTSMFATMAGSSVPVPAWLNSVCMAVAAICALGVVLTGGRETRSWPKRILKGAYALYNVVAGWLGDVLSYARLLALGLATGVIATVINDLASMGGKGLVGGTMFVLIFIIGQLLNFAINVLGAYVHTNRLMYVEFFGKFFEGGGRAFAPLTLSTKHIKLQDEA